MTRRILCILISAVICLGLFCACGSQNADANKSFKNVTITVKVPTISLTPPFDDQVKSSYDFLVKAGEAFSKTYADANVKVNVIEFEAVNQTKEIDDCFGTENAADILYEDFFNSETYVYTGKVAPLDDIITDAVRADIDNNFWDMCTHSGKTYMMPFLYRQNVLGINKELFRQCGLEKYLTDEDRVLTWTMDEWNEILKTLREKLPTGKYPIMLYAANNQGDTHIMTMIRSCGSGFFDSEGYFNLETKEGINGLKWIRSLVDNGYCPPNPEKLEILDCNDLFCNGQLAIYLVNDATESTFDIDLGFVNFPSVNGGITTNFNTGFEVFDNGNAEKLAASKAFIKFIYESEYIDYSAGSIPCSKKVSEKYASGLGEVQKYIDNASTGVRFTGGNPNWVGVRQAFYPNIQKLLSGDNTPEEVAKMLDDDCNAQIKTGYETSKLK